MMRPLNFTALSSADITANQASIAIVADFIVSASAQAVLTGSSPNGTLKLQASNDVVFAPNSPTNWSDIGTTLTITTTGIYLIPVVDICYSFIRLLWTKNTGTGAITAHIKTVGY